MDVTLSKIEIVFVACINMGDAVTISDDFNWFMQRLQVQRATFAGERTACQKIIGSASQSGEACSRE